MDQVWVDYIPNKKIYSFVWLLYFKIACVTIHCVKKLEENQFEVIPSTCTNKLETQKENKGQEDACFISESTCKNLI